jgi:hypothetical protein
VLRGIEPARLQTTESLFWQVSFVNQKGPPATLLHAGIGPITVA